MMITMLGRHFLQASWLLSLAISTCYSSPTDNSQSPPIRTKIQASWNASPLAVQILETAALESPSSFFPLLSTFVSTLDDIPSHTSPLQTGITAKEVYTRSLDLLQSSRLPSAFDEASLDSFKFSLSLKETSPLIETHYQLYKQARNVSYILDTQGSAFQWYGDCQADHLPDFVTYQVCSHSQPISTLQIFEFDHVQEATSGRATSSVLVYADVLSPEFPTLYWQLFQSIPHDNLQIIFRWKPSKHKKDLHKLILSGYGVGLDLKRVDYITIDDRDLQHGTENAREQKVQKKESIARDLIETSDIFAEADAASTELVQLKAEQLQDIGIRATQSIMNSPSPLTALRKLSQDFPRYAHRLVTNWEPESDEDVLQELLEIQTSYIEEGRNYAWLNGMQLKGTDMQPFALLRLMRKERKRASDLMKLGLTAKQAIELLTHPLISNAVGSDPPTRGVLSIADMGDIFDATDRRELEGASASSSSEGTPVDSVIVYWNDIEKDARYRHWPNSLQNLLQPTYPGQMPQVRRNIFNVILALDFEKTISHLILAEHITPFISRGLGVRFGSVPLLSRDSQGSLADLIAKASWYIVEHAGRVVAMEFHKELASIASASLTESDARKAYKAALASYKDKKRRQQHEENEQQLLSFDELKAWSGLDDRLNLARQYNRRLGLSVPKDPNLAGSFFVNGKLFPLNDEFRSNLQQTMQVQMQHVMQQIYFGSVHEEDDVSVYFYDQETTFASRNPAILPEEGKALRFVGLAKSEEATGVRCQGSNIQGAANASMWLIVDVTQPQTTKFLKEAGTFSKGGVRICVVPTGEATSTARKGLVGLSVLQWHERGSEVSEAAQSTISRDSINQGNRLAAHAGLNSELPVIVINGRIVEDFDAEDFGADDFEALLAFEQKTRIAPVAEALADVLQEKSKSEVVAAATSIIGQTFFGEEDSSFLAKRSPKRSRAYVEIPANLTSVVLGDESAAVLQLACIIDPLSETSQSWSAILETLETMESVSIRLYLNPSMRRTEMPLKRFYRYSVSAEAAFSDTGNEAITDIVFHSIPQSTLLTLALDTQHAWQAFPKESIHDLDNIRLSDLKPSAREKGVEAMFELSNIIVEGHARESRTGQPPRGLQLVLNDGSHPTNTLVMANLGYHQLKANPGLWRYSIRSGRSAEVFELGEIEGKGAAGPTEDGQAQQILLTTFEGVTIFPKFGRKAGMEEVDLLDDGPARPNADIKHKATEVLSGFKHRVQGFFGKGEEAIHNATVARKAADINIFTVASGLLYERMAMIMILSVLKHTESTAKFWFIENFLSPSFKAFIPHLAERYNFQYELVTYTWPAWLRSQKEKQRTIWGYKILFLDVLFPLELDRVIFVDSDQIVRTDLKQLVDLDLKGAPYAYAPMGDDREDMDRFRFWKGGYWAEHLRGRPYHISALYVIDLDRFRQMAAGDRLRGQYQALSADPNSLANLDQDLPNNMQAQLPIYTLDKSWLWCETWCSDEALKDAKTIDLCNNPKTHEPKLARAKRLIPEWTIYDQEIAAVASQVAAENRLKARADGMNSNNAGNSASDSAEAFTDEAGQLEQAREQQKEFVKEGTGIEQELKPKSRKQEIEQDSQGHMRGEL